MKKWKKVLLALSVWFPLFANADKIVLKNGRRIENVTVWKEDGLIKCYRFRSVVGYLKEDVEQIEQAEIKETSDESDFQPKKVRSDNEKQANLHKNDYRQFHVIKIYDGDSFKATDNNIEIIVRLVGIDAPETADKGRRKPAQPYGEEAEKYLVKMILNKTVRIRGYGMGGLQTPARGGLCGK
ncbi:thermonuclease family protein [Desulfonema magnum]|uniref:Nuclease, related to Staphylococcal nuclease (SNase) n=1 Tax=Desulfonema magnum TaxID=45655 RepID=A0A975BSX1_9BACT|nr:thermonuclease family protein [Desulfonema magnum]QTA91051.1 Nuclease, related to Staphylococcal nuclease (SNase) [Desulfonema magnum]